MALVNPHVSIVAIKVNKLNSPIKSYRVAEWVKHKTQPSAAFRRLIAAPKTNRLKGKGWKMIL